MQSDPDSAAAWSQLAPAAFYILLALADGEKHGYAIIKVAASDSGGKVRLGPGTLYRVIKQLLADKLISEVETPAQLAPAAERRRYYRLTDSGHLALEREVERLEQLVAVARAKPLANQV